MVLHTEANHDITCQDTALSLRWRFAPPWQKSESATATIYQVWLTMLSNRPFRVAKSNFMIKMLSYDVRVPVLYLLIQPVFIMQQITSVGTKE